MDVNEINETVGFLHEWELFSNECLIVFNEMHSLCG